MELIKEPKTEYEIFRKNYDRIQRLQKILLLSSAYCHFAKLTVYNSLLKSNNNYAEAENISDFFNNIFEQETSPSEFLHNKDELTNSIIEEYNGYKGWANGELVNHLFENKKIVDAFCKSVEFQNKIMLLKCDNTYLFRTHIAYLINYLLNKVEKEDLEKKLIDFSFFSGEPKKLNFNKFRRKIISIENLYQEIDLKQKSRTEKIIKNI